MTADDPMLEEPTLSGALFEGDAATAGKLMKERQSLTPEEIDLMADLLLGNKAAKAFCSHRLVFKRWGGPSDRLFRAARQVTGTGSRHRPAGAARN